MSKTLAERIAELENEMAVFKEDTDENDTVFKAIHSRLLRIEKELGLTEGIWGDRTSKEEPDEKEEDDEEEDDEEEEVEEVVVRGLYPWDDLRSELDGTCYVIVMSKVGVAGSPSYLNRTAGMTKNIFSWVKEKRDAHVFSTKGRAQDAVVEIKKMIPNGKPLIPPTCKLQVREFKGK